MRTHKNLLKERLIVGGSWALLGKLSTAILSMLINALLARMLVPGDVGYYFLLYSLVSFAALIMQLGLNQAIVKVIAESIGRNNPGRANVAVKTSIKAVLMAGLIGGVLIALGGKAVGEDVSGIIVVAAFWPGVLALQSISSEVLRGFHDIRSSVLFGGLLTSGLMFCMLVFFWISRFEINLADVVLLAFLSIVLNSCLAYYFLFKRNEFVRARADESGSGNKSLFEIARPLWVVSLSLYLLSQADIWIISAYLSQEQVALYGAAFRLLVLIAYPILIINTVLPPIVAELYAKDERQLLERILRNVATLASIPSLIIISCLIYFGDSLLGLFYGAYYRDGYDVLLILSIGQAANILTGSCGVVLMMTGHQKAMMFITVACGLVAVIGAWFFVGVYGLVGVALSSTVSLTLQNIAMLLTVKKATGMWTHVNICSLPSFNRLTY